MNNTNKFEYIWLDGTTPEPQLRSKTKILYALDAEPKVWYFDGSSTLQATGENSDCALIPVHLYNDPIRRDGKFVICEVANTDLTPHVSNTRTFAKNIPDEYWFGFEQEFVLIDPETNWPLGFSADGKAEPQGPYYCAVGHENVRGRDFIEDCVDQFIDAGLTITGINAEVLLGQWEYQLFGKGVSAADDLWLSRYIMDRTAERYKLIVKYSPKPLVEGGWNGSGLHTNFSNEKMRSEGGLEYFEKIFKAFEERKQIHLDNYGSDNHLRLTGEYETAPMDKFSWGISNRGCSMRVPQTTAKNWKGYLEDRRPAAHADPYKIISVIYETIKDI